MKRLYGYGREISGYGYGLLRNEMSVGPCVTKDLLSGTSCRGPDVSGPDVSGPNVSGRAVWGCVIVVPLKHLPIRLHYQIRVIEMILHNRLSYRET